ncbi:MAG TPA: hypothetical protein VIQ24_16420 [Pyrinomonadaceae bacterium]
MAEEKSHDKGNGGGGGQGGPPQVSLRVQTPRGLWSETEPTAADRRPVYPISEKASRVIEDARAVFKFTEADNEYALLLGKERLQPERTLASYHLAAGTLLILSVKGGNA